MPLSGIAEDKLVHEYERRRRFDRYYFIGALVMIAATGFVIWASLSVRNLLLDTQASQTEIEQNQAEIKANQEEIRAAQQAGQVRGFRIRAIGCRTLESLGEPLPVDDCLSAEMRPYFQPEGGGG